MNIFDNRYDIRFANFDEIWEIMDFIEKYWKAGHILARDRRFFEYEFVSDGKINILIAKERESQVIHGIIGFLPSNKDSTYGWDVIWKTREDIATPMLGVEMKKRLEERLGVKAMLSVGDNPRTSVPIMRVIFKYNMVKMRHFYCLADKCEYKIAKVEKCKKMEPQVETKTKVKKLESIEEVRSSYNLKNNENTIPYKDYWYIEKRFFLNPIYKYDVYGLYGEQDECDALLICRTQEYCGEEALRIIDYFGNQKRFEGLGAFFLQKLERYEYIDFYCYGMEEKYIISAGMIENDDDDKNIIPDYFNPFEPSKVDIWAGASTKEDCMFFKGDADQDRPC